METESQSSSCSHQCLSTCCTCTPTNIYWQFLQGSKTLKVSANFFPATDLQLSLSVNLPALLFLLFGQITFFSLCPRHRFCTPAVSFCINCKSTFCSAVELARDQTSSVQEATQTAARAIMLCCVHLGLRCRLKLQSAVA